MIFIPIQTGVHFNGIVLWPQVIPKRQVTYPAPPLCTNISLASNVQINV